MPLIIDDSNWLTFQPDLNGFVDPQNGGGESRFCSAVPRDWTKHKYGSVGKTDPPVPIIGINEWPERIAERIAKKQTNKDLWRLSGVPILDQDGLNYCHAYSPARALMMSRFRAGLPHVLLSAGSIGGPVTGYRNEGAWIGDDLRQILRGGASSVEFVPMDQVSRSGWKAGAEENALLHRAEEVWELRSRDLVQHVSTLLAGFEVCIGLNYWSHAVTDVDPVDLHPGAKIVDLDRFGIEFANSWGENWGEGGFAVRAGSRKFADEAYVVRTVTLSEA